MNIRCVCGSEIRGDAERDMTPIRRWQENHEPCPERHAASAERQPVVTIAFDVDASITAEQMRDYIKSALAQKDREVRSTVM